MRRNKKDRPVAGALAKLLDAVLHRPAEVTPVPSDAATGKGTNTDVA